MDTRYFIVRHQIGYIEMWVLLDSDSEPKPKPKPEQNQARPVTAHRELSVRIIMLVMQCASLCLCWRVCVCVCWIKRGVAMQRAMSHTHTRERCGNKKPQGFITLASLVSSLRQAEEKRMRGRRRRLRRKD